MSTSLHDTEREHVNHRIYARIPTTHAHRLNTHRNKSKIVRHATHAYLDAPIDHDQQGDPLTWAAATRRQTIRVTGSLLNEIDHFIDAGHAPNRSVVVRQAIARYLGDYEEGR